MSLCLLAVGSKELIFSDKGISTPSRLEAGSSSMQNEAADVEELPLVRHRSRRNSSGSVESGGDIGDVEVSPPSSPVQQDNVSHPLRSGNDLPSDEVFPFSFQLFIYIFG